MVSSLFSGVRAPWLNYLEVAELGELLVTIIQLADIRLRLEVNDAVCSNVTTLCKSLPTLVTRVWALSCVSALVGLGKVPNQPPVTRYTQRAAVLP
jgi:hypothetical protein